METPLVYGNLDTSFVNLAALIRHLRERQFAGQLRVKFKDYQAEITFAAANQISIEEYDQITGRITEGDKALERLLIRARTPGGVISVYQFVVESEISEPEVSVKTEARAIKKPGIRKEVLSFAPSGDSRADDKISGAAGSDDFLNLAPKNLSPLSFEFTNRVENRARQTQISAADRQMLLQLVGEMLGAVEEVLARANLDFPAMLAAARDEIASDYPFLNPSSGAFQYADGAAQMSEPMNAKLFAASINEVLRRLLERLADDPHSAEVYRRATQQILSFIYRRKTLCDKFFITPQLEKIIGV